MKKYTITDFRKQYPDDDACLDKLFKVRFSGITCPDCNNDKEFTRVKNRRSYQCPCCGFQIYPTQGTVFEKTTTPLTFWFYAIFLQTTTRNGVAAKELERQFNICYKTALRMSHQIKKLMANNSTEPLTGIVEMDETFVGGKRANKHLSVRHDPNRSVQGYMDMIPVFGMLQRDGFVRVGVISEAKGDVLKPIIRKAIDKESIIITDGFGGYKDLHLEFKGHEIINHAQDEYVRGDWHTNTIEGFWSQLKRTIKGTHIQVSRRHLQKYVDEVAFRYMHRDQQDTMFESILNRVVSHR